MTTITRLFSFGFLCATALLGGCGGCSDGAASSDPSGSLDGDGGPGAASDGGATNADAEPSGDAGSTTEAGFLSLACTQCQMPGEMDSSTTTRMTFSMWFTNSKSSPKMGRSMGLKIGVRL